MVPRVLGVVPRVLGVIPRVLGVVPRVLGVVPRVLGVVPSLWVAVPPSPTGRGEGGVPSVPARPLSWPSGTPQGAAPRVRPGRGRRGPAPSARAWASAAVARLDAARSSRATRSGLACRSAVPRRA